MTTIPRRVMALPPNTPFRPGTDTLPDELILFDRDYFTDLYSRMPSTVGPRMERLFWMSLANACKALARPDDLGMYASYRAEGCLYNQTACDGMGYDTSTTFFHIMKAFVEYQLAHKWYDLDQETMVLTVRPC